MSQPSARSVHTDRPLTNISLAYMQEREGFIAGRVFPRVPVQKQTDSYFTYDRNAWLRDEAQLRAPGSESAGSGYDVSTDTYRADVYAFHKDLDEQTLANADVPLNLEAEAAKFVTEKMLLQQEIKWQATYFAASIWANDYTGAGGSPNFLYWNNYTDSDPIDDVEGWKETILQTTGQRANKLVLGYQVWRKLKNHPMFIDRIKYTQGVTGRTITTGMAAAMFDLDEVLVSYSLKATNNEGGTAAQSFIFGKSALLLHVAPSPGLLTPSAGYIFEWEGISQGMGANVGMSRIEMPHIRSTRIEAQTAYSMKIVAADLGVFAASVVQ